MAWNLSLFQFVILLPWLALLSSSLEGCGHKEGHKEEHKEDKFWVFDLEADPNETVDVYNSVKGFADEALSELKSLTPGYTTQWPSELSQDVIDKMMSQPKDRRALTTYTDSGWDPNQQKPSKPSWKPDSPRKPKAKQPNIVFVLVDDWGHNDHFSSSTMQPGATPTLDAWKAKGVNLKRYYTAHFCTPSRGQLLTGRYAFKIGMQARGGHPNLPLTESTIFDELKSVGYHTALVGKWDMGFESWSHTPTWRGVDTFYGYWCGYTEFYNYSCPRVDFNPDIPDLHDGEDPASERWDHEHITLVLKNKTRSIIEHHASERKGQPLFLYYAMMAVHFGKHGFLSSAGGMDKKTQKYMDMCSVAWTKWDNSEDRDNNAAAIAQAKGYCANTIMMDEAFADLECALKKSNMLEDTILIVSGDNGQLTGGHRMVKGLEGSNFPLLGGKSTLADGGIHNTALVLGSPKWGLPTSGTTYNGLVHISDWLVTFMNLATDNWDGKLLSGHRPDGYDVWPYLTGSLSPHVAEFANATDSPPIRTEAIIAWEPKGTLDRENKPWPYDFGVLIKGNLKFIVNGHLLWTDDVQEPVPMSDRKPPVVLKLNTSQIDRGVCKSSGVPSAVSEEVVALFASSDHGRSEEQQDRILPLRSPLTWRSWTKQHRVVIGIVGMVASGAVAGFLVVAKFRHRYVYEDQARDVELE